MIADLRFREHLQEIAVRSNQSYFGGSLALGTDTGLKRNENQDRLLAACVSGRHGSGTTLFAVVADGMGGMMDGAECATIALSAFFEELAFEFIGPLDERLTKAVHQANWRVHEIYGERGGSTLSAIAIGPDGRGCGVNVGDSRIYASTPAGLVQLTTDDTLKAAFGGDGNDLIQFVGMGSGIKPHIVNIPPFSHSLFVTSDGVHYPEQSTFSEILTRSPDPKSAVDRALALARWLGSPDNASIIAIELGRLRQELHVANPYPFSIYGVDSATKFMERFTTPLRPRFEPPQEKPVELPKKRTRAKKARKANNIPSQLEIKISPRAEEDREDS